MGSKKGKKAFHKCSSLPAFYKSRKLPSKYYLRRFPRAAEPMIEYYDKEEKFVESWLAARMNAVAAGYLSMSIVKEEEKRRHEPGLESLINQIRW